MKITVKQLREIIKETLTFDQRDTDRWDDPNSTDGWPQISMYDRGYDDYAENGHDQPAHLENEEYMAGWEAAQDDVQDYHGEL